MACGSVSAAGCDAQHTPTAGERAVPSPPAWCPRGYTWAVLRGFRQPGDGIARLIMLRIAAGGQHHAAGARRRGTPLRSPPASPSTVACIMVSRSLSSRGSTTWVSGSPKRQLYSMTLGPSGREHQPEIQAAAGRCGPRRSWPRWWAGKSSSMQRWAISGGIVGIGGHGAHAAGVQALVAVQGTLVVHGGYHGHDGLPVGKGQDGHLRPGEELLNDHPAAGRRRSALSSIMERTASSRLLPGSGR